MAEMMLRWIVQRSTWQFSPTHPLRAWRCGTVSAQLCYNQSEPGRVGSAGTGSDHLLPMEGKQMATGFPKRFCFPRHWSLRERLEHHSIPEPNSGCLLWLGTHNPGGHGKISLNGREMLTHRVAWELANGPIPAGLCVCHKCDVPLCINPNHLFIGTHLENMQDMLRKGRRSPLAGGRGERCKTAKITAGQAREIREAAGTISAMSRRYGLARSTIRQIRDRKSWRHVT